VDEDLDDTVVVPVRPPEQVVGPDLDDTVVTTGRRTASAATTHPDPSPRAEASCYAYRIGEAEPIELDRPSYIGRRPSSPRIPAAVLPRLVRVASPRREVSATHLELRQLGGSVVATDLRSTNGSIVMLPGSVPRKLRQGESVVLSPGTLVDIGDDNIIQILPMQRSGRQP
jgi:hypothetical protein